MMIFLKNLSDTGIPDPRTGIQQGSVHSACCLFSYFIGPKNDWGGGVRGWGSGKKYTYK